MICPKCKNDVTRPLVLFRGSIACPVCTAPFVVGGAMSFTKENDADFHLSEESFFRGIKEKKTYYVDLALELCKRACEAGNPEAYLRMGYYYEKNLIREPLSKNYRLMIAYEYYSMVCNNKIESGDLNHHVDEGDLRRHAADRMLRMLSGFPEGEQINPRYSVNYNKSELVQKGLVDSEVSFSDAKRQSDVLTLEEGLSDLLNRRTNALISVYRIRGSELESLLPEEGSGGRTAFIQVAEERDLFIRYYINTPGVRDKNSKAVSTPSQIKSFVETVRQNPDREFVLLFFNGKYKPCFLKEREKETVMKKLFMENEHIDTIVDNVGGQSVFAFYEDDVYYCIKNGKISNLGTDFRDYIKGDKNL